MSSVKFLGTCDDVTTCDCCGKKNLKATVALSINDADPVYYGVVCASKALRMESKVIRSEARKADDAKYQAKLAADRAAWAAEQAPWFAFLAAHGKGNDNFSRIESLGGYAEARKKFKGQ